MLFDFKGRKTELQNKAAAELGIGQNKDHVCQMAYPLAVTIHTVSDYHMLLNARKEIIKIDTCFKLLIEFFCNLKTFGKD